MYLVKDNKIRISVRNLVEFIFRSGDIDNRRTSAPDFNAMQEGIRLHKKIQNSKGIFYKPEVSLKIDIPISSGEMDYNIALEGRADGIECEWKEENGKSIPISDVIIDEIKTTARDVAKIENAEYVHKAQAMCYAYIFASMYELEKVEIQITYCNIDTEFIRFFKESYNFEILKEWFDNLIAEFKKWTDFIFKSKKKRQGSIKNLSFPFTYRKGQKELIVSVYKSISRNRALYIQAPTGVGKTISAIYPAIMSIGQEMGDKIFYLTAKTITRTVAEEAFDLLRKEELLFRTVTITARDKICIMQTRDCNPISCTCAKGHFDRINDAVYDMITHEYKIDRNTIEIYAIKHQVCPFELSLDSSYWCDGIICDYNYVFDPNVRLKRYFADGAKGDYIFLIDEAHNLVERARNMYSAELCKEDFLELKKLIGISDKKLTSSLEKSNKKLLLLKRECENYTELQSIGELVTGLEKNFTYLLKFIDEHKSIESIDKIVTFFLKLRHFLNIYEMMDERYRIYTEILADESFHLKLFCIDPSRNITDCMNQGISSIFFSATLLPIQYYKEMLTGNMDDYAVYVQSPFDEENRRIVISDDVTSRYTRRNDKEYEKVCDYIEQIISVERGNYLVFFPSYSYLQKIYDTLSIRCSMSDSKERIVKQSMEMSETEREQFLSHFTASGEKNRVATLGFCVTGGVFSEGIDLKNEALIGVIILGTGLPMVCSEREILKSFFDQQGKNGFDYAYVYPGMNKVLQAAGRVIRTEHDKGIIALLDERFFNRGYSILFPREWNRIYHVTKSTVRKTIEEFWSIHKKK